LKQIRGSAAPFLLNIDISLMKILTYRLRPL